MGEKVTRLIKWVKNGEVLRIGETSVRISLVSTQRNRSQLLIEAGEDVRIVSEKVLMEPQKSNA
jgi:sRNA-binding carbon storage regulator CsrA